MNSHLLIPSTELRHCHRAQQQQPTHEAGWEQAEFRSVCFNGAITLEIWSTLPTLPSSEDLQTKNCPGNALIVFRN